MSADASTATAATSLSKKLFWIGWGVTILPALLFVASAGMKLSQNPDIAKDFDTKLGWSPSLLLPLAIIELISVAVYLNPRTNVLGAILLTGYLGGATATHLRVGDPPMNIATPVIVGVLFWLGLFLRDSRIRAMIPFRL